MLKCQPKCHKSKTFLTMQMLYMRACRWRLFCVVGDPFSKYWSNASLFSEDGSTIVFADDGSECLDRLDTRGFSNFPSWSASNGYLIRKELMDKIFIFFYAINVAFVFLKYGNTKKLHWKIVVFSLEIKTTESFQQKWNLRKITFMGYIYHIGKVTFLK
jgi:hypothetical protein